MTLTKFLEDLELDLVRWRIEEDLSSEITISAKEKVLKLLEEKVNELKNLGTFDFVAEEEIKIFIEKHLG